MINILTGTPFASVPRLHHRADEVSLEGDSSAGSRRALLAARGAMMSGSKSWSPVVGSYIEQPSTNNWMIVPIPTSWDAMEIDFYINADYSICSAIRQTYRLAITGSGTSMFIRASGDQVTLPNMIPSRNMVRFDRANRKTYLYGDLVLESTVEIPDYESFVLFSRLNGGNDTSRAGARIYRVTFLFGGSPTADYRPRVVDDVVGLYDLVGQTMYGKASASMPDYIYGED